MIDSFRTDLYALQRKRSNLLLDFTPASDEVKQVDADIRAAQHQIVRAEKDVYSVGSKSVSRNPDYATAVSGVITSDVAIATGEATIRANEGLLARLHTEQRNLADQRSRFEDLMRRREASVQQYEQLRRGITEVDVRRSTASSSIRLLDPAMTPTSPVSPKPLLNALMALFLGAFLAAAMALLAEYFAAGRDEDLLLLPQVAGIPLLGTVPVALPAPLSGELPILARPSEYADDTYREVGYLLAHLQQGRRGGAPVVLLTGTRTDDTTASVAAQLAAILIRDGMRVTLVDADREHPRLNRVFGAPDAPGLADVLAGRARPVDILHIGADKRLRFLAAGSPEETAAGTERGYRSLFSELASDTDLVLVSGPSVFGLRQAPALQKAAEGLVVVTPPRVSAVESLARARRLLTNGMAPVIHGAVIAEAIEDNLAWDASENKEPL